MIKMNGECFGLKKCVLMLLVFSMLIGIFAACKDHKENDNTTGMGNSVITDEGLDLPPSLNYDGTEFTVLFSQRLYDQTESEVAYEYSELDGDVVKEAVYKRNDLVKKRLGVDIKGIFSDWSELQNYCLTSITAEDHEFDAICTRIEQQTALAESGYLFNLSDIETLDLSKKWWDSEVTEKYTFFDDTIYFASGDINYYDDYALSAIVFNKDKFDELKFEYPYELVDNGDWTFDKFYELFRGRSVDLDEMNVWDEHDFYGFSTNAGMIINFLMGFGEDLVTKSPDNSELNLAVFDESASERVVSKAYKVFNALVKNEDVLNADKKLGYEVADAMFGNGKALMASTMLGFIPQIPRSNSAVNYGVLPMPKYDNSQDRYYTPVTCSWATAYSVVANCEDIEKVGNIMTAMGYYSQSTIDDAVVNKIFYNRMVDDSRDTEMVKLIMENKFMPINGVFRLTWGSEIHSLMCGITITEIFTMVSDFSAKRSSLELEMQTAMENFKKYE